MNNNELLEKYYDFLLELQEKWGINEDCMQMIYLDFLQYSNKKLRDLDYKNEMKYWLVRLVKNYWFSKTSRYYYQYKHYYDIVKEPLEQQNTDEDDWIEE